MEEIDIQIRDKEAQLSGLNLECVEKASELTRTLISSAESKQSVTDHYVQKKLEFDEYCDKRLLDIKEKNEKLDERTESVTLRETTAKQLSSLQNDLKTSNKELSWVNDKIFKAKGELKEVEESKEKTMLSVSRLNLLVELLPKLEKDIELLVNKKLKLTSDISEMLDSSTLELTKAREELLRITDFAKLKVEEANQAEYRCKTYVDELYSHMNNYEVVRSRLESVFKTRYPELDLKI